MGRRGDPSGQTRELTGEPSMQEGMMDGDGRVAPTCGNGMSTREHWDGCPSVFDLRRNVRVMGRGTVPVPRDDGENTISQNNERFGVIQGGETPPLR